VAQYKFQFFLHSCAVYFSALRICQTSPPHPFLFIIAISLAGLDNVFSIELLIKPSKSSFPWAFSFRGSFFQIYNYSSCHKTDMACHVKFCLDTFIKHFKPLQSFREFSAKSINIIKTNSVQHTREDLTVNARLILICTSSYFHPQWTCLIVISQSTWLSTHILKVLRALC